MPRLVSISGYSPVLTSLALTGTAEASLGAALATSGLGWTRSIPAWTTGPTRLQS